MRNKRSAQVATSDDDDESPSPTRRRLRKHNGDDYEQEDDEEKHRKRRKHVRNQSESEEEDGEDAEEDPPEDAKPVGESVRVSGKGRTRRTHFESFELDGTQYDLVFPEKMFDFLDAPVPFIVGIQHKPVDWKLKTSNFVHVDVLKDQILRGTNPLRKRMKMIQLMKKNLNWRKTLTLS